VSTTTPEGSQRRRRRKSRGSRRSRTMWKDIR